MNKKKTVTKVKPQVWYIAIATIVLIVIWFLWSNFSQFIIKKDMTIKKTPIEVTLDAEYKKATGEEKAKKLGMLFTSEFFTWRNKPRKGSIGGIEYVRSDLVDSFRDEVYSNYYEYFTEIRDEVGNNQLPQVENIKLVAFRNVDVLPLTSRVLFDETKSPKDIMALDVKITYDSSTNNEQRYHHDATVYMSKNSKGDYSVVKLVSK